MSGNIGLYYAQTTFQDDWIKIAALYWDRVARIEWEGRSRRDSKTVQQLVDEIGFIINLTPSSEEISFVADSFVKTIRKHNDVLRQHYSMAALRQHYGLASDSPFPPLYLIPTEFMTTKLLDSLSDSGLGEIVNLLSEIRSRKEYFMAMRGHGVHSTRLVHPEMYLLYMRSLAEKMSFSRQMNLVTNEVFDYVASSGYSLERLMQAALPSDDSFPHLVNSTPSVAELEFQMATIALRSVLPRNISEVSAKQIIKLRNQYRSEMTAFQEYIHGFAADLKNLRDIPDAIALQAHLEVEYEKRLKPQLDDLQKCLKSIGIETVMGALNIRLAVPPILAGTGTLLHLDPVSPLIICAGAIAFSIFPVIQKKRQETRNTIRSSPVAYLLRIQETLEPAQAATQVVQRARQIFHPQ